MATYVQLSGSCDDIHFTDEVLVDLVLFLGRDGQLFVPWIERTREANVIAQVHQILVALGSAGAFTAVYRVITAYLSRHKDREVTLECGDRRIVMKGHSYAEEAEIARLLLPDGGLKSEAAPSKAGTEIAKSVT